MCEVVHHAVKALKAGYDKRTTEVDIGQFGASGEDTSQICHRRFVHVVVCGGVVCVSDSEGGRLSISLASAAVTS